MKKLHTAPRLLCLAIATAFPVLALAEDDIERLTKPESTVTLGVGDVNTDNQRYGMYNGQAEAGTHLMGDASVLRKNDASGTWFRLDARNLGLSTRELRVEHERQGDWGYYLDYTQIPRYAPYDVHTNLTGIGEANVALPVNGANTQQARSTAPDAEFKTERFRTSLGFMKYLNPQLEFAVKFQNEEKRGERLFGRGSGARQEFLAEPIDSTTRQLDMTLSYLGNKFQLTGGYYGSFFQNDNTALNITGGAAALNVAGANGIRVIALPPDNEAHQLYLSGAYDFTRTTRATFKYAYTRALQTDTFARDPNLVNISGRNNLGGRLDTTLFQAGITSRPTHQLSLLANLRYEDRDDKTKLAQYITPGASTSTDGFNEQRSLKTLNGKLEASYQLGEYRLTGGIDYEDKDRSMNGVRVVGYRAETEETSYRAEVKRSLSDSISGVLSYTVSNRLGSDWQQIRRPATTNALLQPIYIADRDRNKFKLLTDWSPTDALSVQVAFEDARDSYGQRERAAGGRDMGARDGYNQLFSLDATYAINDNWKINGYASAYVSQIDQAASAVSATVAATTYWTAAMKSIGTNLGIGLKGKLTGKIDFGADVLWAEDRNKYNLGGTADSNGAGAGAGTGGTIRDSLPDINWLQTTFKVYATYAYDKDTKLRLDYVHDRRKTNDWTWANVTYLDGTWLGQEPLEKVHFLGASVQYSFR